jgi:hypothetical protein
VETPQEGKVAMQPVPQPTTETKSPQNEVLEIQVSGAKGFEGNRWRVAFTNYLKGLDQQKRPVGYRPKLHFWMGDKDTITLSRNAGATYCAYGVATTPGRIPVLPVPAKSLRIVKGSEPGKVEQGLRDFVNDNSIKVPQSTSRRSSNRVDTNGFGSRRALPISAPTSRAWELCVSASRSLLTESAIL